MALTSHRTFPRSATRSANEASSTIRTGSPSSTVTRRSRSGSPSNKPKVAINIYNDHGLGFFLDKHADICDRCRARIQATRTKAGASRSSIRFLARPLMLSWHIIESMVADHFDITSCQELAVDHGFVVPMQLFWPGAPHNPDMPKHRCRFQRQHGAAPDPDARTRALDFGRALRKAIQSFPGRYQRGDAWARAACRISSTASAPASSTRSLIRYCMEKIVSDP